MISFKIINNKLIDVLALMDVGAISECYIRPWEKGIAFGKKPDVSMEGATLKPNAFEELSYDDEEQIELIAVDGILNKLKKIPKTDILEVTIDGEKFKFKSCGSVKYKGEFGLLGIIDELPNEKCWTGLELPYSVNITIMGKDLVNYLKYLNPQNKDVEISTTPSVINLSTDDDTKSESIEIPKDELNVLEYDDNAKVYFRGSVLLPIVTYFEKYDITFEFGSNFPLRIMYEDDEVKLWGNLAPVIKN